LSKKAQIIINYYATDDNLNCAREGVESGAIVVYIDRSKVEFFPMVNMAEKILCMIEQDRVGRQKR